MNRNLLILIVALTSIFADCGSGTETSRRDFLPGYIGRAGEVLVIMEKNYWDGPAGQVVKEALEAYVDVLPQAERMFDVLQLNHEGFDRYTRPHRNIIYVDIKDNIHYKDPKIQVLREKYAKDQILINASAMTEEDFVNDFAKVGKTIAEKINDAEIARLIKYHKRFGEKGSDQKLKEKYGVAFDFYDQCTLTEEHDDFMWMHKVTARAKDQQMHDVQQGIMMYTYPYVDDSTFTMEYLLKKRDSVMKYKVPGPNPGSYMQTEFFYDPVMEETTLNGQYAVLIHGLWKMEGAFMGGPFVSLTTYDESRGKIVTAEGFVFAPKFDKREYLREVEAVVKSLKIIPELSDSLTAAINEN